MKITLVGSIAAHKGSLLINVSFINEYEIIMMGLNTEVLWFVFNTSLQVRDQQLQ